MFIFSFSFFSYSLVNKKTQEMNEMNEMNDNKILGTCELGTCELCKTTSVKLELILDKMICYECSPGFIEAIGNIKNVLIERETIEKEEFNKLLA